MLLLSAMRKGPASSVLIPIRCDLASGKKARAYGWESALRSQKSPGITSSVVFAKSDSALS